MEVSERPPDHRGTVAHAWLWVGLMGGAIAWVLHLLLAYGIAEFGCASTVGQTQWLGFSAVAWLEAIASVAMLVAAILSSVIAKRNQIAFSQAETANRLEPQDPRLFMARSGVLTSRLFVFIIAVQSLPLMFYLREC